MDDARRYAARGDQMSGKALSHLRPYVVNLTQGRFSTGGRYQTTRADVDAIFDRHIPAAVAARDTPLPIAIWAHGGLISEGSGLRIAHDQVRWWRDNGVYPLHFVWESGLLDALGETLRGLPPRAARDIWDYTTDPMIETVARPVGSRLWLAMKTSAALASAEDGGAAYVAQRLGEYVTAHPNDLTVHAVGHSAGAIFHAHFLPVLLESGVPRIESLQLLAPAVRGDVFLSRLAPLLGERIAELVLFTMRRELERDDTCLGLYRKSLLYLVQRSFEPRSDTAILGLEDSLTTDDELAALFGIGRTEGRKGTVVWSTTDDAAPKDLRSTSTSHGGFDNDGPTMASVARRVTGRDDVVAFPEHARQAARRAWARTDAGPGLPANAAVVVPSAGGPLAPATTGRGRLRALCVGINAYPPPAQLLGCVPDARAWALRLESMKFQVDLLLDADATREGILSAFTALIKNSQPGDVLVFQYSGHGTQVEDASADEVGGTNGAYDEALCPVDYVRGRLLIDDDIRTVIDGLPTGVALTVFLDCCHSGSGTRFAESYPDAAPIDEESIVRPRYVYAGEELNTLHREFRAEHPTAPRSGARSGVRDVLFSAALDRELAYETDGQGDFTRHAVDLLADGHVGLTNGEFAARLLDRFGPGRRQTPQLDRADLVGHLPFLWAGGAGAGL